MEAKENKRAGDGELLIVRLGCDDIPAVLELMSEVVSRLPANDLYAMDDEAYLRAHAAEAGEIFGVFHEGKLSAYSVLSFSRENGAKVGAELGLGADELPYLASLDGTVVHEELRGRGLQLRFHRLREERARINGYAYLYATVHPANAPSIRNLEAAGFTMKFARPMYGGKPRKCYFKRLS